MTRPRPAGDEILQDIQVMLHSDANYANIRSLKVILRERLPRGDNTQCPCPEMVLQFTKAVGFRTMDCELQDNHKR